MDIILVKPQMGENIGAAARAMANFGLTTLKLVAPRDGWPNKIAEANSVGAFDHMNPIEVFDTVEDAVAPYNTVYATTARPRDMRKKVFTPETAVTEILKTPDQKSAILFGGERAGLDNDDIAHAHNIITLPTNDAFSSLNLGQCVLALCYELKRQTDSTKPHKPTGKSDIANAQDLNEFVTRLNTELENAHFFRNEDMKPTMTRNIRAIFTHGDLTQQEVSTLQGILSALIGNKNGGKN